MVGSMQVFMEVTATRTRLRLASAESSYWSPLAHFVQVQEQSRLSYLKGRSLFLKRDIQDIPF